MLLAVDSSGGTSVAVVDSVRAVRAVAAEPDPRRHAEVVGSLIEEVLAQAGVTPQELEGVVTGMGPGPFTGLRVGIAAARAFAFGAGLPVHPLVSHDAIALEAYLGGACGPLTVVTDARRREHYWSSYAGLDEAGLPRRESGPALASPETVPGGPRVEHAPVSAAVLVVLAERVLAAQRPFARDLALYLREPDAVPAASVKRVSG